MSGTYVIDVEAIGATKPEEGAEDELALCPPRAQVVAVGLEHVDSTERRCLLATSKPAEETEADLAGRRIDERVALQNGSGMQRGTSLEWCEDEFGVLARANELLGKAERIVTFNGRGYDIPVLLHRTLVAGAKVSPRLVAAAREYRFRPNLHVDLREQFTFFGAFRNGTLRDYCLAHGMEDPKASGDGNQVAALVAAGKWIELAEYCLGDVRSEAALYRMWCEQVGVA